jgi:hypothetical protein
MVIREPDLSQSERIPVIQIPGSPLTLYLIRQNTPSMLRRLQYARGATIFAPTFAFSTEQHPEAYSHAAVVFIANADDEGSISLDRYSFAPGLTHVSS